MTHSKQNAYCEGCRSHTYKSDSTFIGCDLVPVYGNVICPCVECLVKSICKIVCYKLSEYRMMVQRKEHQRNHGII